MKEIRGRTALVTGASSGIGEEFARRLAARGANLLLVARREAQLAELCRNLSAAHGISARYLPLDLSADGAGTELLDYTGRQGLRVDLLINNAGFGSSGEFAGQPLERELQMIRLNVCALAELTHLYLREMIARGEGAIINVASMAGFQPVPYMANYAATKAYVLHLSEGLWAEAKPYGVTVMALCPGPTDTEFFDTAGIQGLPDAVMQRSGEVVDAALNGVLAGRGRVVPGWVNKLLIASQRFVSRDLVLRVTARAMQKGSDGRGGKD